MSTSDIVIILAIIVAVYFFVFKKSDVPTINKEVPLVNPLDAISERKKLPTMTHEELRKYDGKDGRPIYIGILNDVFDCSAGDKFYGPGGAYEVFAGRDITLAAAKFSTEEKYLEDHNIENITHAERDSLRHYFNVLAGKYIPVGRLDKKKVKNA